MQYTERKLLTFSFALTPLGARQSIVKPIASTISRERFGEVSESIPIKASDTTISWTSALFSRLELVNHQP